MKKILKALLVFTFLAVQFIPLANVEATSGKNDDSGKITITNAVEGQNYSIYQVLVLESYDTEREAYTYKVTEDWLGFFTGMGAGASYVDVQEKTNIVTWKNGVSKEDSIVKELAKEALIYAKEKNISGITIKAEDKVVEFKNLNLGYYLVDSSLGALCNLTTTNPIVEIVEKNGIPTVEKTVKEDSTNIYGETNNDEIGKTIYYQTKINVKNGAENYVLYDKMDAGLTLNGNSVSIVLKRENQEDKTLELNKDYVLSTTTEGYTFVIDFTDEFEKTLVDKDVLVVNYNAVLNEFAVVGGTGNKNETYLKYGDNNETNHDETRTYTFSFNLIKENAQNEQLDGAKFNLYDAATNGNMIALVETDVANTYRVATESEKSVEGFVSATIVAGKVTILGLDDDASYYLEEIEAPDGYNKLTSRVEVRLNSTITDKDCLITLTGEKPGTVNYDKGSVTIINTTGDLLPSTGGIGTIMFVTIGSILVLGFGVLLVAKLRMSKMALY